MHIVATVNANLAGHIRRERRIMCARFSRPCRRFDRITRQISASEVGKRCSVNAALNTEYA